MLLTKRTAQLLPTAMMGRRQETAQGLSTAGSARSPLCDGAGRARVEPGPDAQPARPSLASCARSSSIGGAAAESSGLSAGSSALSRMSHGGIEKRSSW